MTALLDLLSSALVSEVQPSRQQDVVVPIPFSAARQRRRGFNQGELMAERLAAAVGRPLRLDLLESARETEVQAPLDAEQRQQNVSGAFSARAVGGLWVLLVDDVTMTGTTLNEAAGGAHVFGLEIPRED